MKNEYLMRVVRQFEKSASGKLTPQEQDELDNAVSELRMQREEPIDLSKHDTERMLRSFHESMGTTERPRNLVWLRAAAAVLIATAGFMVTWYVANFPEQPLDKLILNDGSLVWLTDGSVLDYPRQFEGDKREVTLRGEALFEVAKDQSKPFIIHCGKYVASVVGTSFNLKSTENKIELTVLTGNVRLTTVDADSSILVGSHEHIVLWESQGVVEKRVSIDTDVTGVLMNTQYNMMFEDTRMEDIIRRVEGKFDVDIEVEDADINNCMISADFTDQSLPVTLSVISEALNVKYEIVGDLVYIKGPGCK